MAIAFRSAGAVTNAAGGSIPLPSGWQENDILVMWFVNGYQGSSPSAPSGWSRKTQGTEMSFYWKRAGSSESAPSFSGVSASSAAQILAFSGCVTAGDPFAAFTTYPSGSPTSGINLGSNTDCMVIAFVSKWQWDTAPSTPTNIGGNATTNRAGGYSSGDEDWDGEGYPFFNGCWVYADIRASSGTTSNLTFSNAIGGALAGLKPSAGNEYSNSITETASAADSLSVVGADRVSLTEAATAADSVTASGSTPLWVGAGAWAERTGGGSLSVPMPAGIQAGDLLFLFLPDLSSTPAGWTTVPNATGRWAYKWAGASEGSVSASTPGTGSSIVFAFRDVHAKSISLWTRASTGTSPIASINLTRPRVLNVLLWDSFQSATNPSPSGWGGLTQHYNSAAPVNTTKRAGAWSVLRDEGATGTVTFTTVSGGAMLPLLLVGPLGIAEDISDVDITPDATADADEAAFDRRDTTPEEDVSGVAVVTDDIKVAGDPYMVSCGGTACGNGYFQVPMPPGVQAGDLLIAMGFAPESGQSPPAGGGWVHAATYNYVRVAGDNEPAYETWGANDNKLRACVIAAYRNVDTSTLPTQGNGRARPECGGYTNAPGTYLMGDPGWGFGNQSAALAGFTGLPKRAIVIQSFQSEGSDSYPLHPTDANNVVGVKYANLPASTLDHLSLATGTTSGGYQAFFRLGFFSTVIQTDNASTGNHQFGVKGFGGCPYSTQVDPSPGPIAWFSNMWLPRGVPGVEVYDIGKVTDYVADIAEVQAVGNAQDSLAVSAVLAVSASEASSADDTLADQASVLDDLPESGTAEALFLDLLEATEPMPEIGDAADSLVDQGEASDTVVEEGSGTDSLDAWFEADAEVTEAASADESLAQYVVAWPTVDEIGAADDVLADVLWTYVGITEVGAAGFVAAAGEENIYESAFASDAVLDATIYVEFAPEPSTAAESIATQVQASNGPAEAGDAQAAAAATIIANEIVLEDADAADALSSGVVVGAQASESGSAGDALSPYATVEKTIGEAGSAADVLSPSATMLASLDEPGTADDSVATRATVTEPMPESASAQDGLSHQVPTPDDLVDWTKTVLVVRVRQTPTFTVRARSYDLKAAVRTFNLLVANRSNTLTVQKRDVNIEAKRRVK